MRRPAQIVAFIYFAVALAFRAQANPRIAAGGSASFSGLAGTVPTFEVTASPSLIGPHLSLGAQFGDTRYIYGEAAVSYILTLGVGGGRLWGAERSIAGHLFLGIPVPLFGLPGANVPIVPIGVTLHAAISPLIVYVEPYYRPQFVPSGVRVHEMGLFVKISATVSKKDWINPPVSW
jgi:hypothetical protein